MRWPKSRQWSLLRHVMANQVAAMNGDAEALADFRALIRSRKGAEAKHKYRQKMKKKLIESAALAALLIVAGCATGNHGGTIQPLTAQLLTTAAVVKGLEHSPDLAGKLRIVQPLVCAVATGAQIAPEDILAAVERSGVNDRDAYALINIVMAIYVSTMPQGTNGPDAHPWAKAVWCDGLAGGLAFSAASKGRNAPPAIIWPRILK